MATICLITTGQPSSNPRIVKEADALTDAGHDVRMICSFWADWADGADRRWLSTRNWTCEYVGGHPVQSRPRYLWTRLRHGAAKRAPLPRGTHRAASRLSFSALSRTTPDLIRMAVATKADLYVAHNPGALPAAVLAAKHHRASAGFDAEDFHAGQFKPDTNGHRAQTLVQSIERTFLLQCDYLTASSSQISKEYVERYGLGAPVTVLNVFPLAQQPARPAERTAQPVRLYWFSQTIGAGRGLEDVVQAMGRLRRDTVELHLRGHWQPGYRQRLYEHARTSGVDVEKIVAHEPGLPEEMPRLAAQCDIGLSPEHPMPLNRDLCLENKLFTYLLAGNAIIAAHTRAKARLFGTMAPNAKLYEPGNVDALAGSLRSWTENRKRLDAARRQSWELGRVRYNWDKEKSVFLGAIGRVLYNVRA